VEKMRRKEREIKDSKEIDEIIEKADVCRIALSDNNIPYIVTMNFGYKKGKKPALFFHCASEGKKIEITRRNNVACFQMDIEHKLVKTNMRCNCGMQYRSVVGMGRISFIAKKEDKIEALNILMKHYTGQDHHSFEEQYINRTTILRLDIDEISGKKCTY
jgi:nitroimidazol reductase NimA-like FMN-containing flavoprotein (pyridoxamine 5'-phosphate oxidase superfamily)